MKDVVVKLKLLLNASYLFILVVRLDFSAFFVHVGSSFIVVYRSIRIFCGCSDSGVMQLRLPVVPYPE